MSEPVQTVVIGMPCVSTVTTFAILDVLASVGRDWEMIHGEDPKPSPFCPKLLTLDGEVYRDPNGRRITPDGSFADVPKAGLIIVPDLHVHPYAPNPKAFGPVAEWISDQHRQGAIVTSVCSGALLLAETGLLDGIEATTHWAYSDALKLKYPEVRMQRERILIPAGEGHRIITAGGASTWADLLLYLIARFVSAEEARRIAKIYLIEPHSEGQMCYASLTAGRQHMDLLVADAQVWAAQNYDDPNPVAAMARRSGLTERSLLRRFRAATGQSPIDYVQTLRIEEAKQILETTQTPIEDIAAEVGYSEPSSFRLAFRKRVGISASVYRKKWRAAVPVDA